MDDPVNGAEHFISYIWVVKLRFFTYGVVLNFLFYSGGLFFLPKQFSLPTNPV